MTALLALLAIAGYQNRDKIAEMLRERPKTIRAFHSRAASEVCWASSAWATPAPEEFSVVASANS
jgi:hypothetical protein